MDKTGSLTCSSSNDGPLRADNTGKSGDALTDVMFGKYDAYRRSYDLIFHWGTMDPRRSSKRVKIGSYRSYQRILALARVMTIDNAVNMLYNAPGSMEIHDID
jgi:hypothetical protein